jgi:hypothetical protein
MLTTIPDAINKMTRQVILNHPSHYRCAIIRATATRSEPLSGHLPTLGGLGVLLADDEDALAFAQIGTGWLLPADPYAAAPMTDKLDAENGAAGEVTFLIAPEDPALVVAKNDIIYRYHDYGVTQAFTVVDIRAQIAIPPFCLRYVCNRCEAVAFTRG